jgi:hypothetical protein
MHRTSMEKMATYIDTKYGDEAAQEWISGKRLNPPEPAHSQVILDRHAARVKATKDRIELKLKGLKSEKGAIEAEIQVASTRALLKFSICQWKNTLRLKSRHTLALSLKRLREKSYTRTTHSKC